MVPQPLLGREAVQDGTSATTDPNARNTGASLGCVNSSSIHPERVLFTNGSFVPGHLQNLETLPPRSSVSHETNGPSSVHCVFNLVHGFLDDFVHNILDDFVHGFFNDFVHGFLGDFIHGFLNDFIHGFLNDFVHDN
jgi:hypothetical protein